MASSSLHATTSKLSQPLFGTRCSVLGAWVYWITMKSMAGFCLIYCHWFTTPRQSQCFTGILLMDKPLRHATLVLIVFELQGMSVIHYRNLRKYCIICCILEIVLNMPIIGLGTTKSSIPSRQSKGPHAGGTHAYVILTGRIHLHASEKDFKGCIT